MGEKALTQLSAVELVGGCREERSSSDSSKAASGDLRQQDGDGSEARRREETRAGELRSMLPRKAPNTAFTRRILSGS